MFRMLACFLTVGLSMLLPEATAAGQAIAEGQMPTAPSARPPIPGRDVAPVKAGTARIRGRVVAADNGQPLRKALVRATADGRPPRMASTDADGKYELKDLPAGRYHITVTKGSFVSVAYGQLRFFEAGTPLEIAEAQLLDKLDFALPRGAVITGRVVDEFGEPLADVRVAPMRYQYGPRGRRLTASGRQGTTNDIGEYRLFGLAPGRYVLSATQQAGGATILDGLSEDRSGYAPTYYPGTPDASQAQRVTIGIGQSLGDINMPLVPTRTARVSGMVSNAQGQPMSGGFVVALQRGGGTSLGTNGTQVKPDGSFTLSGLAPGEYLLQAMAIGERSEIAAGQVTVTGEDVTDVAVTAMKTIIGTGRVIVDPAFAASVPSSGLRLAALPINPDDNVLAPLDTGGKVKDDYSFDVKARPGLVLIRADGIPPGWALKAVRHHGNDVTDTGLEFRRDEEMTGIEVEITKAATEVSGVVTNSRSQPVKDYTVVIFSTSRERWGYLSRFIQSVRPDQDGRFKVQALPADEYFAIALEYTEPGEASDPEFLDRIKSRATPFRLNDGETKIMDLKIAASL